MIDKINVNWKKIVLLIIVVLVVYLLFFSKLRMMWLPEGEYIESVTSPNGKYTLRSYKYIGGATTDWHLRVEVVENETRKSFNIYYKYHEYDSDMKWIDNENVIINNRKMNIHKDYVLE